LKILPDWAIEEDGFVLANQSLSVSIGFLNPHHIKAQKR
jgi:hypothetical protein